MTTGMRYVKMVYEQGSFTKAAEKLFISQPSLSAMVKKTETELGAAIFDRSSTPLELTEAGQAYLEYIDATARNEALLNEKLWDIQNLNKGHICIGGSNVWDDEPKEELTLFQYAKRCVKDCIENSRFRIVKSFEKDRYNRGRYRAETQEYTFEEYLHQHLGIDDEVKSYLDKQVDEVRQQVNRDVKAAFDESTKAMLSNAVLQVLMANDTYKKIEGNIACIADRPQE